MLISSKHNIRQHEPLFQSAIQHAKKNTAAVLLQNGLSCESILDMVAGKLSHAQINYLRRKLMLKDKDCFHTHATLFMDVFQSRALANHVMLHIPKAGGTSVCASVQREGTLISPGGNCWKDDFCPMWCGCEELQPTRPALQSIAGGKILS